MSEKRKGIFGKVFMKRRVADSDTGGNVPNGQEMKTVHKDSISSSGTSSSSQDDHGFMGFGSFRQKPRENNLALYENEAQSNFLNALVGGYTTPGPQERAASKNAKAKADLGVMLGVYLPTIQHILGVTMFIRLGWCVGVAGVGETFGMLFLCCLCTFLTCISLSAVATNGVIESGGAYFMISRNLGPEFGSAVGILFYLANTVATAMYLVGGVEILLLYIFPDLTIGGSAVHTDTGPMGMMTHNLRLYGTILVIIEFLIVAMGVKFVQLLAPVSLVCVILSILAVYAGAVEKSIYPDAGQKVCMIGPRLLQSKAYMPENATLDELCDYCVPTNPHLLDSLCIGNNVTKTCSQIWNISELACVNGFPGGHHTLIENLGSSYPHTGEYLQGKEADTTVEIFQDAKTSFFLILAIYFPAVTGIFTGTNMSGDLKNPQKSIPGGTIAAQLTTSFVYFSLALVFGFTITPEVLRDKYGQSLNGGMTASLMAWPSPWVLLIGSFLSTFGAALQCLCSAPRLLQSIAKDDVIPILAPFAKVTKSNEPFNGLIITTIIAELGILMGAMDSIAAVVDFFFLMCYAFVNMICAMHSVLGAPNWRPRYTYYHWSLSLLGAALCFFIMFSTHIEYAIASIVLCLVIYKYVEYKGAKKEWGDGFRGLALSTAQYSIQKIDENKKDAKNWRPQLLLLHSMPWSKEMLDVRYLNLLNLAAQMKAGKGLTMVVSFVRGDSSTQSDVERAQEIKNRMKKDMDAVRLRGFPKSILYNEDQIRGCVNTLIQSIGIGGLRPNTLLLSWPTKPSDDDGSATMEYNTFIDKLLVGTLNGMALVVAKGITDFPDRKITGTIDVYWIVKDGGLCLLIAFLLRQHKVWRGCKLRVMCVAGSSENNVKMREVLKKYIYELRIDAEIKVVDMNESSATEEAFVRTLYMEDRNKLLRELRQNMREGADHQLTTGSVDSTRRHASTDAETPGSENGANMDTINSTSSRFDHLDKKKVFKMQTAIRLNAMMKENSTESQLVIITLPKAPRGEEAAHDFFHYMEEMSSGINRMLFVRGTGDEVITESS
ncbi:unnamed protein product [Bursaphelenchus okinawaensis]|uniref:Solute carrier family 12 member 6 n=1 Tax=Bursaphelenchus okinawaensis TaxID=465554 RepID=A0A811KVZ2_9BILA|nr:unnamed protein product [Bursaphelenchus okinawaensis]CAG9112822.1 unnamed protein product [Bursaphelenchus okinawaensis]